MVDRLCLQCKGGKDLCGKGRCELIEGFRNSMPSVEHNKKELFGSSPPSVFVGRYGYPKVNIGPMLPPMRMFNAGRLDDTKGLFGKPIEEVVRLRSSLYRSNVKARIGEAKNPGRILEATQLLAMASKPVDTEVHLNKAPGLDKGSMNPFTAPMGPAVQARKVWLTENAKVPRKVDHIVGDTDVKATTGMVEMYNGGIDLEQVIKLLSAGLLGKGKDRKFVPTRWSITATEDALGKDYMDIVKGHQEIGEYELYTASYVGNDFHIILCPRIWSFEMVEVWLKGAFWGASARPINDWEGYGGRKGYADKITGAYYSAKLMILEHLLSRARQATAIVYREITSDYWAPLGVWVIRETVRDAMSKRPQKFTTLDEAVASITNGVHVKHWAQSSKLIKDLRTQRTLKDYL